MIVYEESLSQSGLKWIHIEQLKPDEMEEIKKDHDLPRDFISDTRDKYEVARTEFLDQGADQAKLILLQYPLQVKSKLNQTEYESRPISIIVVDQQIITLSQHTPEFIHLLHNYFFHDPATASELDVESFILQLILLNVKTFVQALEDILVDIEHMQVDVEHSSKNKELYRQMSNETSLVLLQSAIQNNKKVFEQIRRYPLSALTDDHQRKMHDVMVENQQAQVMSQTALDLSDHLSGIFENVISNNLNLIMKILTSITIILTIPTIIAGVWGMNVNLPLDGHPHAFTILFIFTLILSVLTYILLKKYDFF